MNQSAQHMVSAAAGSAPEAAARTSVSRRSGERLRWGLTGLAAIFLVVMIAAAGLQPASRTERPGAGESLAVLGVAPGPATRPAGD
jgi:hypothetical protein